MHRVIGPSVQSTSGGRHISGTGAGNLRKNPNGDGYLLDVWATIENRGHNDPVHDRTFEGTASFYVKDFDDNRITGGEISVGMLEPDQSAKGKVTVQVGEYKPYQVFFYTSSQG